MIGALLAEINNWFCYEIERGEHTIAEGVPSTSLLDGQYYRIKGSVFNDGVYKRGEESLTDETFKGEIWRLAVPAAIVALSAEITTFESENVPTAKTSESFGGYSYSKATVDGVAAAWTDVFKAKLKPYRKL